MGWVGCVGWARDLRPTAAEPNRTAGAGGRGAERLRADLRPTATAGRGGAGQAGEGRRAQGGRVITHLRPWWLCGGSDAGAGGKTPVILNGGGPAVAGMGIFS